MTNTIASRRILKSAIAQCFPHLTPSDEQYRALIKLGALIQAERQRGAIDPFRGTNLGCQEERL